MLAVGGATATGATVTVAVPLFPSLVAVIVADPAATPVTTPVADTVAMAGFALVHVIARPVSTLPAASLGVAVSCAVLPTKTFVVAGLTATEATGAVGTLTAPVPLWPPPLAALVARPPAPPLPRPPPD